ACSALFGRAEVFGPDRLARKHVLLTETVINEFLELVAALLVFSFEALGFLVDPMTGEHLDRGLPDQLRFLEVQHAWSSGWPLHRRVIGLHRDLDACFAGAVRLCVFNLDDQVWVEVAIWFLNV